LFATREVFDARACARILSEARAADKAAAEVQRQGYSRVDGDVRRGKQAEMSAPTKACVKRGLLALKPRLEEHFKIELTDCEEPQFLSYEEGDLFQPHQDGRNDPDAPEFIKKRRVSVVVFLNGAAEDPGPDSYAGGSLTFYGLINEPGWEKYGFPLFGEPGLLVAFPSRLMHEVTPVTQGQRYTVVSWFFSSPSWTLTVAARRAGPRDPLRGSGAMGAGSGR